MLLLLAAMLAAAAPAGAAPVKPGSWTDADKDGVGTAHSKASNVLYTLDDGRLTEVYYPNLSTPSVRHLEFLVGDAEGGLRSEHTAARHRIELPDARSLGYRQVNTDRRGAWRITKTYTTDPDRATLLVHVKFEALNGGPKRLFLEYDPALMNTPADDRGRGAVAFDKRGASALLAQPALRRVVSGKRGRKGGDLVQTARTRLTGRGDATEMTLSLGFARKPAGARANARASLEAGFDPLKSKYDTGWHGYLDSLPKPPASVDRYRELYDVSLMTLAALEDKTVPGASIASPSMPWTWGDGETESPSGPYHLVWPRDLYQVATAQLAAGDREAAGRLLTYLFDRAQKRDGSFPQNAEVDGTEHWDKVQMDQVAFPIILAWQLGRTDAKTWTDHVQRAADFIVREGPKSEQERWENQEGFSPGTIAAEIAGLVCAADIARRNGDVASAERYERTADEWQSKVESWTATSNGPYSKKPYYLRVTKDRKPNKGTRYGIGDTGPRNADQRTVVDPSFLELVRLGVKRFDDPTVLNSIDVVDRELSVDLPGGRLWHRFSFDGYGETRSGDPWFIEDQEKPQSEQPRTLGRAWPIFAGERGEYELLAGRSATAQLATIASAAGPGLMLPEQVWDGRAPTGKAGFKAGKGTMSATPLAWTHAQFVRLAWSIDAGRPVERPQIVACRYAGC